MKRHRVALQLVLLCGTAALLAGCAGVRGSVSLYRDDREAALYEETQPEREGQFAIRGDELCAMLDTPERETDEPTPDSSTYGQVLKAAIYARLGEPASGEVWLVGGSWYERFDVTSITDTPAADGRRSIRVEGRTGNKRVVVDFSGKSDDDYADLLEDVQRIRVQYTK